MGGVLAHFYGPRGEGLELFFAQVVGNSPIKKFPRGDGQAWNRLIHYSSMFSLKKFISEIVPLWLKNRNQWILGGGVGGTYAWSGLYEGGLYME